MASLGIPRDYSIPQIKILGLEEYLTAHTSLSTSGHTLQ